MAPPKRFFLPKISGTTVLCGEEFNHAKNVLRLSEGEEVTLLDGSGKEYSAIIAKVGKKEMALTVVRESVSDREPQTDVCLLVGALKGDKTELVVQKATELGVSKVYVFNSKYCSAYMNENKLERLRKVAQEASKQCLRATLPQVEYFDKFEDALRAVQGYDNKLFACEFAQKSDVEMQALSGSFALVVGSEGGFAEEEFSLAQSLGFAGITLGKRILRAETAGIAFLSVVMFLAGELK